MHGSPVRFFSILKEKKLTGILFTARTKRQRRIEMYKQTYESTCQKQQDESLP